MEFACIQIDAHLYSYHSILYNDQYSRPIYSNSHQNLQYFLSYLIKKKMPFDLTHFSDIEDDFVNCSLLHSFYCFYQ